MDEYERLEAELSQQYQGYVERQCNLSYLEQQLDEYNKAERDRMEVSQWEEVFNGWEVLLWLCEIKGLSSHLLEKLTPPPVHTTSPLCSNSSYTCSVTLI